MNRRVCYDDSSAQMWGDTNSAKFVSLESGNLLVREPITEINKI